MSVSGMPFAKVANKKIDPTLNQAVHVNSELTGKKVWVYISFQTL
jgi:hypothetical protein